MFEVNVKKREEEEEKEMEDSLGLGFWFQFKYLILIPHKYANIQSGEHEVWKVEGGTKQRL